jgi:hypothetical protein
MKKMSKVLGMVAVGACLALSASALQVQMGYPGSSYGMYQTGNGGEFTISPYGTESLNTSYYFASAKDIGVKGSVQTFCLEANEHVYGYPSAYEAVLNSSANHGGVDGGTDPLSQGTGWLVQQFATGVWDTSYALTYHYGTGRTTSASLLQKAIWMLEEESGYSYSSANMYAKAAFDKFGSWEAAKGGSASDYYVKALNLTKLGSTGRNDIDFRQDQVFYEGKSVPDGGMTVALLGIAMAGLAVLRRRSSKV